MPELPAVMVPRSLGFTSWVTRGAAAREMQATSTADGNKRVAAHAALLFALVNGFECLAARGELVAVTLDVAKGDVQVEELAIWFRQRLWPGER